MIYRITSLTSHSEHHEMLFILTEKWNTVENPFVEDIFVVVC